VTWSGFWLPNLATWLLGGTITAVASVVVGFLLRRWLRQLFGEQRLAAEDALNAADSAASTAAATGAQVEEMKQRMDGLLTALLRQESLALKVRDLENKQGAVFAFMADLEHERHITGNLAEFQRAARSRHE
jgi:selenocysteine lyase/cysteine desulfurase